MRCGKDNEINSCGKIISRGSGATIDSRLVFVLLFTFFCSMDCHRAGRAQRLIRWRSTSNLKLNYYFKLYSLKERA